MQLASLQTVHGEVRFVEVGGFIRADNRPIVKLREGDRLAVRPYRVGLRRTPGRGAPAECVVFRLERRGGWELSVWYWPLTGQTRLTSLLAHRTRLPKLHRVVLRY